MPAKPSRGGAEGAMWSALATSPERSRGGLEMRGKSMPSGRTECVSQCTLSDPWRASDTCRLGCTRVTSTEAQGDPATSQLRHQQHRPRSRDIPTARARQTRRRPRCPRPSECRHPRAGQPSWAATPAAPASARHNQDSPPAEARLTATQMPPAAEQPATLAAVKTMT